MKKLKVFAALILLCATTLVSTGCGVKKEEADVILESWSEDTETSDTVRSDDINLTISDTE